MDDFKGLSRAAAQEDACWNETTCIGLENALIQIYCYIESSHSSKSFNRSFNSSKNIAVRDIAKNTYSLIFDSYGKAR